MVEVSDTLLQFFATLIATLIGVYLAFLLDRWQQERQTRHQAIDHLRSLKSEIELNNERVNINSQIITHLQRRDMKGEHYVLEPFETDAWIAALEEPILGTISNGLYEQLSETYSEVKSVNSLIDRQKDELHHSVLGEMEKLGSTTYPIWTISVHHYSEEKEDVDHLGLGPLIENRSRSLQRNSKIIEDIEKEIEDLDGYPLKQHFIRTHPALMMISSIGVNLRRSISSILRPLKN